MVRSMMKCTMTEGEFQTELVDGRILSGRLHPDFIGPHRHQLLGRLWDLSSTYRQCARRVRQAQYSIIVAWQPEIKKVLFYVQTVLPFRSIASVH